VHGLCEPTFGGVQRESGGVAASQLVLPLAIVILCGKTFTAKDYIY